MPIRTETRDAFTLVGPSCRTSNDDPSAIGTLWGRFFQGGAAAQIPDRISDQLYSLYCDYEGDHTQPYTALLGCMVSQVEELPEGLVAQRVPASTYAVFDATGEQPDTLIATWQRIWATDLDRTFSGDFDVHGDNDQVEIFVAVR